ncbi:neurobeachin-like protein 1 isoform X2 [Periplaneta americana]|uniref:neurobeachin-like protein 1 isoform X2 n=1 Tax=Periplaneta americana TaxID=6978 RepID=UPI0037E99A37
MESKRDIYHLWVQYTTKNEEDFFRQFVKGFVAIWESQLDLDWSRLPDCCPVKHDSGPHLSRLPEELLPAIGKFMYLAKEETEKKSLNSESLKKVELLVRCLIVICRNFDNIPLIASCDYVSQAVGIAATIIHRLVEDNADFGEAGPSFFVHFCHFLECLYDPYFTWRLFLAGIRTDFEKLPLQPALLHVEVVPFVYDCFQTPLIEQFPQLSTELVHVLGAVISGAQHNALRAICPATVNIVMGVVSHSKANTDVRRTAIQCFVMMVQVLDKSSPDQRQIEVGTIIQLYQDSMMELFMNDWVGKTSQTLCEVVSALRSLLTDPRTQEQIQRVMIDNHMLDTIITIIEESVSFTFEKQMLASECVKTITAMLIGSTIGKEMLMKTAGYERLFSALKAVGQPSKELLHALLTMASEEEPSHGSRLMNADVLLPTIRWLGDIDAEDQQWLAEAIYQLSTSNLPSKTLACQRGVTLVVCQTLEDHRKLSQKAVNELIKLLEVLASHSITSYELKQIFLLLREDSDVKFPYRVQLLHAVSSVARKGDYVECNSYFDIQKDSDGISVPGIKKWPGAGYGFSFHCWVRLDNVEESHSVSPTNYRRQLFNLLTSAGTGLEAFFRPDGALVIGINTKKEFLSASVTDFPLLDGQWHCLDICHVAARRPFGQNQLTIYIDGTQRMAAGVKSPAMTDPFTFCTIGSVVQRHSNSSSTATDMKSGDRGGLLPGGMMDRGLLPTLINQVPNYFTLPLRSSAPLDPNVKSFPAGMQDTIWGTPTSLRGQIGLAAMFHEALTPQQVKTLYDGGPNCRSLFALEDVPEFIELTSKLVFCFSPAAYWNNLCLDLAPTNKYDGHVVAPHCQTFSIKNVINGIGGVHALFPILENASKSDEGPDLSFLSPTVEKECRLIEGREGSVDSDEWEILPSSSYSDWKLEQNPVSGFLSLLKNIIAGSTLNQEQLLKNNGLAIIGVLLAKAKPHLIDVNVLMAVQLLIEMARDVSNAMLLRSLYQHVLFNFKIWSRSQFHIRIGHVQYISTVIKDDRKYFRKRYGIPFLLDVIRQYYSSCELLSSEDSKTIRVSLLGLVKYYMQKELNVKEVSAILGFLSAVKEEILLLEVLEMLISYMENKNCKDQIFLLLYEPHSAETLYCLLVEKGFSMELKQKLLKLLSVLLRSDRVYERNKTRLRLQDVSVLGGSSIGMYPGLVALLQDQPLTMEVTAMLFDQILSTDSSGGYAGALSLLHALSLADLNLKLEAARKILTATFMKPNAPHHFAKQVGWQDCITRLLVKRPISTSELKQSGSLPDLMSFDEENLELEDASYSPSSVSRLSTHVTDAAMVLENEIKEVAETVTNAVAGNIHYAADNISSAVASAYSVFRQKTVEMQESLEELGESAVSRLKKRRSLISLYETPPDRECSPSPSQASPRPVRTPQLLASLGLDLDTLSLGNRSGSSSSTEDLSSPNQNDSTASNKDNISIASAQSISNASNEDELDGEEEERLMSIALKQWKELDAEKLVDQEEELCYLVVNILFTVLWRGVEGASKEAWKERGQVMACINLLGLNNELYCSHLQLKLRILEMGVQASLSDLRDVGQTMALSTHAENAAQLMRWIYDLVVLDPNEDTSKKASTKLLDGVLGLLDALLVFQEGPGEEWTEMAKMAFGILLSCAANSNLELCAMATAKLHALIQTRNMKDPEEGAYLLYFMNRIVQKTIEVDNQEHYSFLIPVVKALLEKLSTTLSLGTHLPDLPQTQAGPAFFDDFQSYCQTTQWKTFMEKKVRPLHDTYQAALSGQLTESMNVFWAECYEASKTAVHRRNREVGESKLRFQSQIMGPFRLRQTEDSARYSNLVNQQRNQELLVRRKWRHLKQFFIGPRGAWRSS